MKLLSSTLLKSRHPKSLKNPMLLVQNCTKLHLYGYFIYAHISETTTDRLSSWNFLGYLWRTRPANSIKFWGVELTQNDPLLSLLLLLFKKQEIKVTLSHQRRCRGTLHRLIKKIRWMLQCQMVSSSWNLAATSSQSRNDNQKRCNLVSCRNCSSELMALVAGGRLFQARATAVTKNALHAMSCRWHLEPHAVGSRYSADDGGQVRRQSVEGCQLDRPTLALCRAHNGKPGHITGSGNAWEHATSGVNEAMVIYALKSWLNMWIERRHSVSL